MYTLDLHSSLIDARVDDLRRTMAASRGRRSRADSRFGRGRRQPVPASAIRAMVARLAQ
jgi:hypothetical protein